MHTKHCHAHMRRTASNEKLGRAWEKAIARPVSRGQTLFCTEGKGLGHGHRAVFRPAPWSAYQSQHSIQSHDTWSMWL